MTTSDAEARKRHNRTYYLNGGREKIAARKLVHQQRNAEYVNRLKQGPCTDCGDSFHPAAMQFDHIGSDKEFNIANMVLRPHSIARIDAEIAKCELVCANCHAIRTWERRNGRVAQLVVAPDS